MPLLVMPENTPVMERYRPFLAMGATSLPQQPTLVPAKPRRPCRIATFRLLRCSCRCCPSRPKSMGQGRAIAGSNPIVHGFNLVISVEERPTFGKVHFLTDLIAVPLHCLSFSNSEAKTSIHSSSILMGPFPSEAIGLRRSLQAFPCQALPLSPHSGHRPKCGMGR